MNDFSVKSIFHDYTVRFISNPAWVLQEELKKGDFIIIDNKILELYSDNFKEPLSTVNHIGIDATENQKSYEGLIPVIRELVENGFRKNHRLIAIGGGITQDITAFAASILYRGVPWLFFPTTLLAQCDSCIGSKTSINFANYKNQVGGFYPPNKIFIDLSFLSTLSEAEIQSGLGEMCHYFIVSGEEDFFRFKRDYPSAMGDRDIMTGLIARSLAIKKSYIEIDEFDKKERQVFNYGHSFGHAIESVTNYRVPHGIAVSYGMDMANFISVRLGYIPQHIRDEIRELLSQIWKDFPIRDISLEKFKNALSKDKKNVGAELRLILNNGYGKIFKDSLSMSNQLEGWLLDYFHNEL